MHYRRWRIHGDLDHVENRWTGHVKVDKTCAAMGCDKASGKANYCTMHAQRLRVHGDLDTVLPRGGMRADQEAMTPERFRSLLRRDADGCLVWPRSVNKQGYGHLRYQGKLWGAHQLAFFFEHGRKAKPMTLHTCDNPPCCDPDHLYEGDGSRNMRDMYTRGRGNRPTGSKHHMARLTAAQEAEVAQAYRSAPRGAERTLRGHVADIAAAYGVSVDTVRRVAARAD